MPRNQRDNNNTHAAAFTITNHTADLALDCNSTSDGELADIVGEVVRQLSDMGLLNATVTT